MSLKLISATSSHYARKVRIVLAEKSIPFDLITEVPWNSTTQIPQHNPLEKLPVLIIPADGVPGLIAGSGKQVSVSESHFILEWIEFKFPAPKYPSMLPEDGDQRLEAKEIEVVADGMCDALVLRFFEVQRKDQSQEWIARQMRKVDGGMKWLAGRVRPGKEFLVGERFGLADIAVGAVCGYLDVRYEEYPWRARYPDLSKYVDTLQDRESFRITTPRAQKFVDKIV
ncbi:glutathione S-transferase domain-containing protein [Pseudovirgaria hyperparasitica]|uniref:Glutathione S-transferase domain-containing protein n=1 Tax=Pseudovirgaria hyperparasitica TaxID=470096 RepID=A0A6A6WC50_9PEZI|nr:glutathione S-transferase domain-containing protein [Pseudovirgaria hyperparasitica]KAF2760418.1 glutathione S-transferase domain-containing protein [Pseudovirgaria hyperparasitica]